MYDLPDALGEKIKVGWEIEIKIPKENIVEAMKFLGIDKSSYNYDKASKLIEGENIYMIGFGD